MRNKNNVRKNAKRYSEWLEKQDGFDPASLESLGDNESPNSIRPLSPQLEDVYETLEDLYYSNKFKGRQKQIIALMIEGELNQCEIAKRLNMKQSNVSIEIQKIRKRILKNII